MGQQLPPSALSPISMTEQHGSDADLKGYSCLTCRQRKVRCDRRNPCSNCVKAARQCSFLAPVRGKRKRTKAPKEGLHAKLRRYEELLKSYGAKIESPEYDSDSHSESDSQPDSETAEENPRPRSRATPRTPAHESIKSTLIDKEGSSRYYDRCVQTVGCGLASPRSNSLTSLCQFSLVYSGRTGEICALLCIS